MNISAIELKKRLQASSVQIIDVREELEYHTFNVGGQNIPLARLPLLLGDLELDKDEEIVVVCQRGIRSATAQRIMLNAGFTQVRNLEGGLLALRKLDHQP